MKYIFNIIGNIKKYIGTNFFVQTSVSQKRCYRDSEITFGKKLKSLDKIPRQNSENLAKDSESRFDVSIYQAIRGDIHFFNQIQRPNNHARFPYRDYARYILFPSLAKLR